jgi:hypothetical protein
LMCINTLCEQKKSREKETGKQTQTEVERQRGGKREHALFALLRNGDLYLLAVPIWAHSRVVVSDVNPLDVADPDSVDDKRVNVAPLKLVFVLRRRCKFHLTSVPVFSNNDDENVGIGTCSEMSAQTRGCVSTN